MSDPQEQLSLRRAAALKDLRKIDQSISIYAALRDKSGNISRRLGLVVLIASAIGTTLAFTGSDKPLQTLGLPVSSSFLLSLFGLVVFIVSLVDLFMKHDETARSFEYAAGKLAGLKLDYRRAIDRADFSENDLDALRRQYEETTSSIRAIPERQFNRQKAKHLQKVEISKLLSAHPGESVRSARRRLKEALRHSPGS